MKSHTFLHYLMEYTKLFPEEDILVMCRPSAAHNWADRCLYGSDKFNAFKTYNHRSMLKNEIVIEFDHEDHTVNQKATAEVVKRLRQDGVNYSQWTSGNKSEHVHVLLEIPPDLLDRKTLKKAFLDTYCEGLEVKPDYQLCIDNHLIRSENGLHEKSRGYKSLIRATAGYPKLSVVPGKVWDSYGLRVRQAMVRRASRTASNVKESPSIKFLLKTEDFGTVGDGRERALFILSQVLRDDYSEADLVKFLQDWYRYSGGRKLDSREVQSKVRYSLKKKYNISERYVEEFLQEIGCKI